MMTIYGILVSRAFLVQSIDKRKMIIWFNVFEVQRHGNHMELDEGC